MASVNDLNGLYKQIYAKSIEDAVPGAAHLLKKIPFTAKELQQGNFYNQPVVLAQEQGWSYIAAGGSTTLAGSVDMKLQNAQVLGNIIAGQSQLSVEAAKRALTKGPAAFDDAVGLQMRVMMDSGKKRQEVNFLYGNTPLSLSSTNTNINTTATRIVMQAAEWASGFWAGMQNAKFDAYRSNDATVINATLPYSVLTSNASQTSVTFTNTNTTDLAALDTYVGGAANNAGGAQFYFAGAKGNESDGLKSQLVNVTTLFNIDASKYDLWAGTNYAVPSPGTFSFSQLQKAISKAVNRGLDEDVDVYVNPDTWTNLLNDQAALRMYPNASGTFENGAEELKFFGQNGTVTVIPHIYVKSGDAFVLPMKRVKRIGVSPMTFDIPGTEKGRVFIQLATSLAFEYRCYAQECVFLELPSRGVYVSGIVN